jgi:hypothetical protein
MIGPQAGKAQTEPRYDPHSVETLSGVVSRIGSHTGKRGTPRTRATLKTARGPVEVHLGPTVFLEENKLRLAPGNRITVTGSRVRQDDGGELVIVREVTKGRQVLRLRNEAGRPLWEERHK